MVGDCHSKRMKLDGKEKFWKNFNLCFLFSTIASYSHAIEPYHLCIYLLQYKIQFLIFLSKHGANIWIWFINNKNIKNPYPFYWFFSTYMHIFVYQAWLDFIIVYTFSQFDQLTPRPALSCSKRVGSLFYTILLQLNAATHTTT